MSDPPTPPPFPGTVDATRDCCRPLSRHRSSPHVLRAPRRRYRCRCLRCRHYPHRPPPPHSAQPPLAVGISPRRNPHHGNIEGDSPQLPLPLLPPTPFKAAAAAAGAGAVAVAVGLLILVVLLPAPPAAVVVAPALERKAAGLQRRLRRVVLPGAMPAAVRGETPARGAGSVARSPGARRSRGTPRTGRFVPGSAGSTSSRDR